MQDEGTVVGEEDDAIAWATDFLQHTAVVGVEDAGQGVSCFHGIASLVGAYVDARMVCGDGNEFILVEKGRLIAGDCQRVLYDFDAGEETQDSIDGLVRLLKVDGVGLPGIEAEG